MKPMLSDQMNLKHLARYYNDDAWLMQQKLDGHRVLVQVFDGQVTFLGRNGEPKANAVPARIRQEFEKLRTGNWFIDGELVGGTFWIFDLPFVQHHVDPADPYETRLSVLENFLPAWNPTPCVRLLTTARTPVEKRNLAVEVRTQGGEGVMVKRAAGPYRAGHRSTDSLKAKFISTIDCLVTRTGIEGKENAELAVYDTNGNPKVIGKCSLIGKPPVAVGDVIECTYLYATPDDRLYQPRLTKVRTDKAPSACSITQLRYVTRDLIVPVQLEHP